MNEFIEECRGEWRRLGVPDPVANEMAADLAADLQEAEAEGGSAEDVLGTSAFDPRRFAAAWAVARGVTTATVPTRRSLLRTPVAIALTVLVGVVTIGSGLVLLVGYHSRSFGFAVRRVVAGPGPFRIFGPGPGRFGPGALGPQLNAVHPLAWLLLIVGIVCLGLLAVLYWSPWFSRHRDRRDKGRPTPSWN